MKRSIVTLLGLIFALSLMAAPRLCRAENAAMIIKVEGEVKVQRGGKQKVIKGKMPLELGDKVIVSAKGSAVVLFATGKKVTVTSSLEITEANAKVEGDPAKKDKAKNGVGAAVRGPKSDLKAKGGVSGAVRAAGDAKTVQVLSVLPGSTITTRPVFAWQPSGAAESNKVVLMDEDGEEVWSAKTKDTVAAMPEDAQPLAPGKEYTLEVTSVIDGEEVSGMSTFYVYDPDETTEIDDTVKSIKTEYTAGDDIIIQSMLLADYYVEKEMYNDAIDELKNIETSEKEVGDFK